MTSLPPSNPPASPGGGHWRGTTERTWWYGTKHPLWTKKTLIEFIPESSSSIIWDTRISIHLGSVNAFSRPPPVQNFNFPINNIHLPNHHCPACLFHLYHVHFQSNKYTLQSPICLHRILKSAKKPPKSLTNTCFCCFPPCLPWLSSVFSHRFWSPPRVAPPGARPRRGTGAAAPRGVPAPAPPGPGLPPPAAPSSAI